LFGSNTAINTVKAGKAKLIILAGNCPLNIREDIEYYSRLSDIPVINYNGTSVNLGLVCGKPFMVSALTIRDQGDSDILRILEATNV
jgi:large subunit ribosomal protein L30e